MKIEHIGLQVSDPAAMATWYQTHLGFICRRSADVPVPVRFLTDVTGQVMIEIYRNPKVAVPDYAAADPLIFHLAFVCNDISATLPRLLAAGTTIAEPRMTTPVGDDLIMLRDPWSVPIQLCCRKAPMIDQG